MSDQPTTPPPSTEPTGTENPVDYRNPTTPEAPTFTQPIVAIPDRKFFIKRMIIATVVLVVAGWFLYDGFVRYPARNQKFDDLTKQLEAANAAGDKDRASDVEHERKGMVEKTSDRDIFLNKLIGICLTPLALFLYAKFLRESRGELRLADDTVHVPGHPPVPIGAITGVQNARWEKKGIAFFTYRLADGTSGKFKIDDFVFIRPPTDAIHDELIAKMQQA